MRGSVKKRGSVWCIVYDERQDVGEHGNRRRVQRWRGGFKTKKAAQEELTRTLGSMADDGYVEPERITFLEFCETRWLPHVEETRRPSTVESYRRQLKRHIYPVLGYMPLQKIGPMDIDRLYRLCDQKQGRGDAKLTPATVRVIGAIASSALRQPGRRRGPAFDG